MKVYETFRCIQFSYCKMLNFAVFQHHFSVAFVRSRLTHAYFLFFFFDFISEIDNFEFYLQLYLFLSLFFFFIFLCLREDRSFVLFPFSLSQNFHVIHRLQVFSMTSSVRLFIFCFAARVFQNLFFLFQTRILNGFSLI